MSCPKEKDEKKGNSRQSCRFPTIADAGESIFYYEYHRESEVKNAKASTLVLGTSAELIFTKIKKSG